jgi:serine/threonine-protein kinase
VLHGRAAVSTDEPQPRRRGLAVSERAPEDISAVISVGSSVGNYRVVSKIGAGTMATVYLAEHPRINKKVAIKVINPDLSTSKEMVSRFFTEARAASQISHDHVVDILDFGQTPEGDNFMIMEYLEGQTIASRLKAAGRLDAPTVLHIAVQIVDALHVAHGQGVIHRDLKPDNIYLIKRGPIQDFVKILDFGLAKLLSNSAEGQNHRTSSGSVLGTPHYMSPEQCEGKLTIDGRADLYSVGCIMYQMLTGELPFPGDGFAEVLIKHLGELPPLIRLKVPSVPLSVEKIVLHCLAKDPAYRFQSAEELGRALYDPEGFSNWIGDDMMRIVGPLPGGRKMSLTPALSPSGPQMPTVLGEGVPAALTAVTPAQTGAGGRSAVGPAGAGPVASGPGPSPAGSSQLSAGATVSIMAPSSMPSAAATSALPSPLSARAPTPPGVAAAQSGLRPQGPAARSGLLPPPPPSVLDVPVMAEASQLAEVPVVANRAAPQQATMIGELTPAAMSALARPPQGGLVPKLEPPPLPPPLSSPPSLPPLPPAGSPDSPPGPASGAPNAPPLPANPFEIQTLRPDFSGPGVPLPVSPAQLGAAASSHPSQPAVPGHRPSQPMAMMAPPVRSTGASLPAMTPGTAPAAPDGLLGRLASTPIGQALAALPPERRKLAIVAGAASGVSLLLVILIIALWPSKVPVELRSLPPLAEVLRDGKVIGKTPLTLRLKKGESVKLLLRRSGYAEAEQDLSADDEPGLVVTLNKAEDKPADKPKAGGDPETDKPGETDPPSKGGDKPATKVEAPPNKGGDKPAAKPADKPADKSGGKKKTGGKKKKVTEF